MAEKYYKGNNIGLTFDGTGWKLNNLPQNFINPEAFSTKDPVFPKVPTTPPTTTEPEKDPCPPGYIFDKTLNQCVPDPNYQTDFLGQPQRTQPTGTDSTEAEFVDFDASTSQGRKDMYDHALKRGYINEKGELLGPPKAPTIGIMTPIVQFGITRQYNRWLKELGRYDAEMKAKGLPTGFAQAIGYAKILPRFYETTSATQLRGRDVDVSDDATIKTTDKTVDTSVTLDDDLDSQITETKAGEPVDIISDIRDSKSGTSYTDASGDTYTSTGDGGIRFEPKVSKPAVSQKTKGGVSYGTGRGGTASAQRQMKKQSAPSSAAESFKQYGRF